MFFSPEILTRKDSGMGLLWLAATLGSKSTFKKLHKRSVLTADITQLCDQIAEPPEPLALRLSSNLMVGAARVYKVKQDIFLTDVTACFNSLKKVVQEFQSRSESDLQMAQTSARPSALTLAADSRAAFTMDFNAMIADWDDYLNIGKKSGSAVDGDEDNDFLPESQHKKQKKQKGIPLPEKLRADLYTLKENHDHLLSASFDASFNGNGGLDLSSSQIDGGLGFDDNIFGVSDAFDISGGLGDDLARELGEGWGTPSKDRNEPIMDMDQPHYPELGEAGKEMDLEFDLGFNAGHEVDMPVDFPVTPSRRREPSRSNNHRISGSDKENVPPPSRRNSMEMPHSASAMNNLSHALIAQDYERQLENVKNSAPNKVKRTRLLLDARTELTDDELKVARAQYLKGQNLLRREIDLKKFCKDGTKIIDDMIWGVPYGIHAHVLADFWLENFKVQVEARSGALHINDPREPPAKRRKVVQVQPLHDIEEESIKKILDIPLDAHFDVPMDMGMDMGWEDNFYNVGNMGQEPGLPSSEDPGQGRRISRPPSVLGSHLGLDVGTQNALDGSQRSFFPWDHAGASSSVAGTAFSLLGRGSDRGVDRAEVKLRSLDSPFSRRESSYMASQVGSAAGKAGFSPMTLGRNAELVGEDFAFQVPAEDSVALESQPGDVNLATLERNSFNFLEYAKMQYQTLPRSSSFTFDDIVPNSTSTRHVAAAAFYHCLVLATKDLIRLQQIDAYGAVAIVIV